MEFRLLGAPEVWHDGRRVKLTAGKPVALLAAGLLRANRIVSMPNLVDAVWGDAPPASAVALLQTYVSALRRVLHVDGLQVIVTRPPGYLFNVEGQCIDVSLFESLTAKGRTAAAAGQHAEAAETLRAALAIWRGPALDGLGTPVLRQAADGLEELRLSVLEERINAELHLNRIGPLAAELATLVAASPLRETLRAQQMLVLYRLGRQADALDVFHQARRTIRSELGVEPGPELRRMHQAILTADSALDPPPSPVVTLTHAGPPDGRDAPEDAQEKEETAETAVTEESYEPDEPHIGLENGRRRSDPADRLPRQLPPQAGQLIGREEETAALRHTLLNATADQAVCCVVTGKAGSGKTALVRVVAHAVSDAFGDGQLYAVFRGSRSGTEETYEILGAFLRALGEPASRLPDSLEERSTLFRSRIAGRRILIVVDNAGPEAQVRPLLPAHGGSAALLTSRTALVGLESQSTLGLDVLEPAQALRLLARLVGAERVAAEPTAAEEIVRLCGGLPLAVRTVGARLAARQRWPLSVLADRLRDEYRRLDELVAGDLEVRATLHLSYSGLPDTSRLAFRRLGVVGPCQFSPWLLAPLLDVPPAEAESFAERLTDAQLVDAAGLGLDGQVRYDMHDLIRLFARERAEAEESSDDQRGAIERLGRLLLDLIAGLHAGDRSATGPVPAEGRPVRPDPPAGPPAAPPAGALAWIEQEEWLLVQIVERACRLGLHWIACELCGALRPWFRRRNSFDAWWRTHDMALQAARDAGDRSSEVLLLYGLGRLRSEQDRLDDAAEYYRAALVMFRDQGSQRGEVDCLVGLATTHREHGRFPRALQLLAEADEICARIDYVIGLAECAYGIGYIYREVGRLTDAEAALERALAAYRRGGDRRGEGMTLRSMAMVHRAGGELATAERLAVQAMTVFHALGSELSLAYGKQCLAKIRLRQGRTEHAAELLREALASCTAFGDRYGTALVTRTIGELHLAAGELDLAATYLAAARKQWVAMGLDLFRARTDRDLAELHRRRGDHAAAAEAHASALATFQRYGTREQLELATVREAEQERSPRPGA